MAAVAAGLALNLLKQETPYALTKGMGLLTPGVVAQQLVVAVTLRLKRGKPQNPPLLKPPIGKQ